MTELSKDADNNLLKESLKICKRAFAYNFIFSFFINILMLSTSIYSLQILDRVLSSYSMETLWMLSLIMVVVYVILAFLQTIRAFIFTQISNWLDKKLSSPLLESSITYEAKTKGSQNLRDLQTLKSFITSPAFTHLFDAPWAIIYFIVIFFIHWINGLIVVAGAAILFILAFLNERLTKKQIEKSNAINVASMKQIEAISRNAEIIKAMGMKNNITNAWQKTNKEFVKITTDVSVRSSLIANITKSIRLFIQMAVMAVGAVLVIKGRMSAGGIIATSILTGKALMPFDQAITIYKSFLNTKKSYGRLSDNLIKHENTEEKIELPEPTGKLSLEKLIYQIPTQKQIVIKGVNITINNSEIIGIIGPSGSGKTTLARMMANVITPTSGNVRMDSADFKNQDSEKIGEYIGYLPQDIELFSSSIKENIARMQKDANSEKIIQAAKFANIHDFILQLPEAYETNCENLSAGQRQRVALARAFFGAPKLVILDEPNSNLDTDGEKALLSTINNAKESSITTIMITHKPSLLSAVDKILVMHNGEAKMFDEREKVLKKLG